MAFVSKKQFNVECIRDVSWAYTDDAGRAQGPKKGEVCTVVEVRSRMTEDPFVDELGFKLAGYGDGVYLAKYFGGFSLPGRGCGRGRDTPSR